MIILNLHCTNGRQNKVAKITYIANAGFLIKVDDKKILVDAVFGDQDYEWCDIPDSAQVKSIINASAPFSGVNLIAATHYHIDHFYAPFVVKHLVNNKKGIFISSRQVIDTMVAENNYDNIKSRVVDITPEHLK